MKAIFSGSSFSQCVDRQFRDDVLIYPAFEKRDVAVSEFGPFWICSQASSNFQ